MIENRGGARKGAGRKKGEEKKMIWFSVPAKDAEYLKVEVSKFIHKLSNAKRKL